MQQSPVTPSIEQDAEQIYRQQRADHWDDVAGSLDDRFHLAHSYRRRLEQIYLNLVPPGQRILELGCGQGDLLAALQPSAGLGVDLSGRMIDRAREHYPDLEFVVGDAHEIDRGEKFDFIILSDLVNELWDVQEVLERVKALSTPRTRLILNFYSRLWQWPLGTARSLGLAKPLLPQNWLTPDDVSNLLKLVGFEKVRHWPEILFPLNVPFLAGFFNRFLVKIWPFRIGALTNLIVARPPQIPDRGGSPPVVSVIVPARNEEGNVPQIFDRTPEMAGGTEIIFVEGGSEDDTYAAAEQAIADKPHRRCGLYRQTGKGKGDAVRLGMEKASGDIVLILDADLTVPPEDLPRFVEALRSGRGEFINGVRLVYPMQDQAMRFLNLVANKSFSLAFSWLLDQPIKDTLCGTKALWKDDYQRIVANRSYFGDFDPYGDFDLIFGAARQSLRIMDIPIRYRQRTYGQTNIDRWSGGWLLLRMTVFAARRLKFV